MTTSGVIGAEPFNTRKIVDLAYQRCGVIPAQITPEMLNTATQSLYVFLATFCNRTVPSWCIEKLILPLYEGIQQVDLPVGSVNALNVNYRTIQAEVQEDITVVARTYTYEAGNITTVGVLWASTSVAVTLQASDDGVTWDTVGSIAADEYSAGEWSWIDVPTKTSYTYFRLTSTTLIRASEVYLGNTPSEIPLGILNRDQYVDQTNKVFPGQPTNYYPQKNFPLIQLNLWPVPWSASKYCQLIVWRHRHVMDVGTLRQNVEVPLVWYEALIANLAALVAPSTQGIQMDRITYLEEKALLRLNEAWDGDSDRTPTLLQVDISPYTR